MLRSEDHALGVARIEALRQTPGTKDQLRCPECNITGIKSRRNLAPTYRCNAGHEFDEPAKTVVTCSLFRADFGESFVPSCTARRAADTATHLVDEVLPHMPMRQWS